MQNKTKPPKATDRRRKPDAFFSTIELLETRRLLSTAQLALPSIQIMPDAGSGAVAGFSPSEIRNAYGFNTVSNAGTGQTIAIVDAYSDPNISSDLSTFDSQFGLPSGNLKIVSETGSTTSLPAENAGWDLEESLDVEWAHAIAPNANIMLVEANSSGLSDLLTAVNYARSVASVSVISMSWGSSEFMGETSYDSDFTTPTGHEGITFIAASGDEGSQYGPEWPASSPNVLSVGGTTLNVANSTGAYSSETGWTGSTGGVSVFEREPAYQASAQNTGHRTTPDVAYDANPSTGFAVYDSVPYDGLNGWDEVGGTSAGAPQWAALVAIADQGRVADTLGTLNGSSQTLPLLYSLYNSTQYSQAFHDQTSGGSHYVAAPGYDGVTGLGSPRAAFVIQELISASAGTQSGITTTTITKATASPVRAVSGRRAVITDPVQAAATNFSGTQSASIFASLNTASQPIAQIDSLSASGTAQQTTLNHAIAAIRTTATVDSSQTSAIDPSTFVNAGNFMVARLTGFMQNFSVSLAIPEFRWESNVLNSVVNLSHEVSTDAGKSAGFVEKLLVSDASAMAQVANTIAARLADESTMIEKETAILAGAAILIGTYSIRPRREPQTALYQRKRPRYLCVGE